MKPETPEVAAARRLAEEAERVLGRSPAFQRLDPSARDAILRDVGTLRQALSAKERPLPPPPGHPHPVAFETPLDRRTPWSRGRAGGGNGSAEGAGGGDGDAARPTPAPRPAATETLAARAGALSDEIDFPKFVAGLVHGTFDAIVEAAIRQMEAFADLVSAVAKSTDQFTSQNVSLNQARDHLLERHGQDLQLVLPAPGGPGEPRLVARPRGGGDGDESPPPAWLADYGLAGEELSDEVIEEQLVPAARRSLGESRLQTLATMVLLGMNRIVVKDGSLSARVRFRAVASDKASVDYAASHDQGPEGWGRRGSRTYSNPTTMISTVGANVQAETGLRAELFGEVRINFASETLPLERFADAARMSLLQRNARWAAAGAAPQGGAALPATGTPPVETLPAQEASPPAAPGGSQIPANGGR